MKFVVQIIAIIIGITISFLPSSAANLHWKNSGTDMLKAASYDENKVPGVDDTIYFDEPMVTQPYLSGDLTVSGVFFGHDSPTPTTEDTDPNGYVFTGMEGKKLTLAATNGKYALNSSNTACTVVFKIPVVLSGIKPLFVAYGTRVVFEGPVSTSDEWTQDVNSETKGKDSSHLGTLVFANANPDFKPKKLHLSYSTHIELRHPLALNNIKEFVSGRWGATDFPRIYNYSGSPALFDSLTYWSGESHGLDDIFFEGDKFVMTNCEFAVSVRNEKTKNFNAHTVMKTIGAYDWSGSSFSKAGTNVLEVIGLFQEGAGIVGHFSHVRGLLFVHHLVGTVVRPGRRFVMGGTSGELAATLGLTEDIALNAYTNNGVCFSNNGSTIAGFSAISDIVHLQMVDKAGHVLSLTNNVSIEGSSYNYVPRALAFGHPFANGTVVLENDYADTYYPAQVYAYKGGAKVAGRFAGSYNVLAKNNTSFEKQGDGAVAFDGSFNVLFNKPGTVKRGGVLMNCSNTNLHWYVDSGAWLGGKGSITSAEVKAGAALRAGENGEGELTVLGTIKSTTIAATGGLFAEIAYNGGAAPLIFKGGTKQIGFKAASGSKVFVDGEVNKFAPGKNRVKIMDWSQISNQVPESNLTMFNIDNYQVEIIDSKKFKKAWLEKDEENKAIYLVYVRPSEGFSMVFRP